ncbi:hypothetical protein T484DRAFT_1847848 [Baffinella frigidus]|nr:hypothetical protein T484DRAFT_1847848 [Cryptophyta sp. CCMP2293]
MASGGNDGGGVDGGLSRSEEVAELNRRLAIREALAKSFPATDALETTEGRWAALPERIRKVYKIGRVLGQGSFGEVVLAERRSDIPDAAVSHLSLERREERRPPAQFLL